MLTKASAAVPHLFSIERLLKKDAPAAPAHLQQHLQQHLHSDSSVAHLQRLADAIGDPAARVYAPAAPRAAASPLVHAADSSSRPHGPHGPHGPRRPQRLPKRRSSAYPADRDTCSSDTGDEDDGDDDDDDEDADDGHQDDGDVEDDGQDPHGDGDVSDGRRRPRRRSATSVDGEVHCGEVSTSSHKPGMTGDRDRTRQPFRCFRF
ncbi:hypothetical protein ONE63_004823 [Megalurothrips usitatus]|uniref:Uncharacterized protein n=1 Tax=Megalurothrips usitatus TaxID=439358 RepID=A0AAV7X486_9NEOP|nr:hypothetical protein ONE63_004823 [Megalurothrips usitatus]